MQLFPVGGELYKWELGQPVLEAEFYTKEGQVERRAFMGPHSMLIGFSAL